MIFSTLQTLSSIVFLFTSGLLIEGINTLYHQRDYIGLILGLLLIIICTIIGLGLLNAL